MSPLPAVVLHNGTYAHLVLGLPYFGTLGPNVDVEPDKLSATESSDALDAAADVDDGLKALLLHYPCIKTLELPPWMLQSVRGYLFAQFPRTAFSTLTALTFTSGPLSRSGHFTVSLLFEILSLTPVLKRLNFGLIEDARGATTSDSPLPRPACSLEYLSATRFAHYSLLLSSSHDTLVEISVQSTGGLGQLSGQDLQRTLSKCTRVRHLTLLRNQFPSPPIIAACPRITSLRLSAAPSEAEMAALQGRLRIIKIVCSYTRDSAEAFVDAAWIRLRHIIPACPALTDIRFLFFRQGLRGETEACRELRQVCNERRIRLQFAMHPDMD